MKNRGGSINSCLSRSQSSDSELNIKLLSLTTPAKQSRGDSRKISECSDRSNSTKRGLSVSMESCCRICHDGDNEEKLMTACLCLGSIKYVHHACLLKWISRSGDFTCEICKYNYNVIRSRRKAASEWQFPGIGMQGWLHVILFFAFFAMLITSVTWVVWSQTSESSAAVFERTSAEIKYAYMLNGIFILTAVIGITLDSFRQARKYFQRVLALNQEIFIQEYTEKDTDNLVKESCNESDNGKTKAHFSIQNNDRPVSETCWHMGNYANNVPLQEARQSFLHDAVIDDTVFIEIDLDESDSTVMTFIDQTLESERNFDGLEDLAETRI